MRADRNNRLLLPNKGHGFENNRIECFELFNVNENLKRCRTFFVSIADVGKAKNERSK